MDYITLFAIALISIFLKIPLWIQENLFYYDAVEYLSIGRWMARGKGFQLPIKAYFKNDVPVVHSPLRDVVRPPLYPLLIDVLWKIFPSVVFVQFSGVLFSFAAALSAWAATAHFFGASAGRLAGLLTALAPDLFILSKAPMVEPLVSLLSVGIAAGALGLSRGGSWEWGCLTGISLGAYVWTRPNGTALAAAWISACLLLPDLGLGGWIAAALATASWIGYWGFSRTRIPKGEMGAIVAAHLQARSPADLIWLGYPRESSATVSALRQEPVRTVSRVCASLARGLAHGVGPKLLSISGAIGLFLVWPHDSAASLLILLAMANLATTCCFPMDGAASRYLLPSFLLLLPLACAGILRIGIPLLRWTLLGLWIIPFLANDAYHWTRFRKSRWTSYLRRIKAVGDWLRSHAGPEDVIAGFDPWILHWNTERPAVVLPFIDKASDMDAFLKRHRVRWLVDDSGFDKFSWCSTEGWPGAAVRSFSEGRSAQAVLSAQFDEPDGIIRVYALEPVA